MTTGQESLALAIQTALLGEVSPALRGVVFTRENANVALSFFFDGEIEEEDRESASCVESELVAVLPPEVTVRTEIIRRDPPATLHAAGWWVYRRRE